MANTNKKSTIVHDQVVRYVVNGKFNQAILFFTDGSYIQFEHTSRENRWAKASGKKSLADNACRSLEQFRLNAVHLQLYFDDGSDVEFFVPAEKEQTATDSE
jgi:hypothetical protein